MKWIQYFITGFTLIEEKIGRLRKNDQFKIIREK